MSSMAGLEEWSLSHNGAIVYNGGVAFNGIEVYNGVVAQNGTEVCNGLTVCNSKVPCDVTIVQQFKPQWEPSGCKAIRQLAGGPTNQGGRGVS